MGRSGKEIAAQYVETLTAFVKDGNIPRGPNGKANVGAIAEATGIPRQSFYKNPSIRQTVDALNAEAKKDTKQGDKATREKTQRDAETRAMERKVNQLSQHNAALVAENAELRKMLKSERQKNACMDVTLSTGRRVAVPNERT